MKNTIEKKEVDINYQAAHAAHYKTKDLRKAMQLYKVLIDAHPSTKEAEYSRSQISNIARSVVSKEELLNAQIEMVHAHLDLQAPLGVDPIPSDSPAS